MQFQSIILSLVASAAFTNAVIVDLFSDENCQNAAGNRNVYDDSCAPLGGFSSFRITTAGGGGQQLTAYSRNACAGSSTACVQADRVTGDCIRSDNSDGGSNAMGSGEYCGVI